MLIMFKVTLSKLNMTFDTSDQFLEFRSQILSKVKATEK